MAAEMIDALLDDARERRDLMQIGDLARDTGKTVRAIHLYEQLELLKPAGRSKGRYRLYGPEALVRIRWIQKLQDLGFSLPDIKAIVKDVEQRGSASSASRAMESGSRTWLMRASVRRGTRRRVCAAAWRGRRAYNDQAPPKTHPLPRRARL